MLFSRTMRSNVSVKLFELTSGEATRGFAKRPERANGLEGHVVRRQAGRIDGVDAQIAARCRHHGGLGIVAGQPEHAAVVIHDIEHVDVRTVREEQHRLVASGYADERLDHIERRLAICWLSPLAPVMQPSRVLTRPSPAPAGWRPN